jgi:hypothetical protein
LKPWAESSSPFGAEASSLCRGFGLKPNGPVPTIAISNRLKFAPFSPGLNGPISRNNDTRSPEFRVCNSVLGSTPNYPFWKDFVCHIFETQDVDRVDEYNIEKITDPEGLTKFYLENIKRYPEIHLPKRNSFHPLITFKGLSYEKGHSSYGAHLCWGSWRTKDVARKIKTMAVRKITCF